MKHIKIMSGRKTVCEYSIEHCHECPCFYDDSDYGGHCTMKAKVDPDDSYVIPEDCPLNEVPGDITYKDD